MNGKFSVLLVLLSLVSCTQSVKLNRVLGIKGPNYPRVENNKVIFSIKAPDASVVTIAGNFNGWNPQVTALSHLTNQVWSIALPFKPGKKYYYKYVVDGYWIADPR